MVLIIFWMITCVENSSHKESKEDDQEWKGMSMVLHVLLPIAGLALLWGQRGIFSKLLLQLDRSCVSVYCPSLSKREKLLKWASDRLPSTWSSPARTLSSGIPALWKDGSLMCTLINSVVPGACPNPHRHWNKPPQHAQALAYKYLGLVPMFTEEELSGELTATQEQNFLRYLQQLQECITKWQSLDEGNPRFSSQYVARGMGLYTGEQHRKAVFYIYSNGVAKRESNVLMYIRGPFGTEGKATIFTTKDLKTLPTLNELEPANIFPFNSKQSFLKSIPLLGRGSRESGGEISVQVDKEKGRVKVAYIPDYVGMYEINLICNGELLRGCPYSVQVINSLSEERESFIIERMSIEEKITFKKRRILSQVIDCVDETIVVEEKEEAKLKGIELIEATSTLRQEQPHKESRDEVDFATPKEDLELLEGKNLRKAKDSETYNKFPSKTNVEEDENNNFTTQQHLDSEKDTSPICPDHIVPEVEQNNFTQLTLSQKRKNLVKQSSIKSNDSSTFSSDNDRSSVSHDFRELSVMNVLDSIRKNSLTKSYSLSSTVSLPNMTSLEYSEMSHFKERRDYWEKLSSRGSSNFSVARSEQSLQLKQQINVLKNNLDVVKVQEPIGKRKTSKSTDNSLDDCTLVPLVQRKKQLLKEFYEQERQPPEEPVIRPTKTPKQVQASKFFIPIAQRIKTLDKVNTKVNPEKTDELSIKSQFKRAIKFFKNLEQSSKLKVKRSQSFDYECKDVKRNKGGSLNLSNVSDRFRISNLYEDVMGRRNGSFKGAPNKKGVARSLASLSRSSESDDLNSEEENNICYNLFAIKTKSKKRKSIKTLFDINY